MIVLMDEPRFPLVPKLYLGTHLLLAKLHFALITCTGIALRSAMELPHQLRSQIEFGNEGKIEGIS